MSLTSGSLVTSLPLAPFISSLSSAPRVEETLRQVTLGQQAPPVGVVEEATLEVAGIGAPLLSLASGDTPAERSTHENETDEVA